MDTWSPLTPAETQLVWTTVGRSRTLWFRKRNGCKFNSYYITRDLFKVYCSVCAISLFVLPRWIVGDGGRVQPHPWTWVGGSHKLNGNVLFANLTQCGCLMAPLISWRETKLKQFKLHYWNPSALLYRINIPGMFWLAQTWRRHLTCKHELVTRVSPVATARQRRAIIDVLRVPETCISHNNKKNM